MQTSSHFSSFLSFSSQFFRQTNLMQTEFLQVSPLTREVLSLVRKDQDMTSKEYQGHVRSLLESNGFQVKPEWHVADRGDGRSGRINLMAFKYGMSIAIEIDTYTAKKKSLFKLSQSGANEQLVLIQK